MDKLRLRTTLLIPLLLLSVGSTVVSLMILRNIVLRQVRTSLASDLSHSVQTYNNLASRRRELLQRESALLADLPTLKALMTGDDRTIVDGGSEFWQVSGSDLFALLDRNGRLIACYSRTQSPGRAAVQQQIEGALTTLGQPVLFDFGGRLFEVSVQPLLFGERRHQSYLGYVAVGYAIDSRIAREVSEAAAADVTFTVGDTVVASTLHPNLLRELMAQSGQILRSSGEDHNLTLGANPYLAAAVPLPLGNEAEGERGNARLIVLKSYEQASSLIRRVNQWVLTLVALAVLAGTAILFSVSRTLTHPIQNLVEGTRALAVGNFDYHLNQEGVQEIRELSRAFETMRVELRRSQAKLLDSERLATIGRMASSISHDLRHYLSAMYANAEFISDARLPQSQREVLFLEVKTAVHGMTDLLDSLLLFTQTGRALHVSLTSLQAVTSHAVDLVRSHPAARDVTIDVSRLMPLDARVDAGKLGRAVFNILLNACQAARRGKPPARVSIRIQRDAEHVMISVVDSGPGVPQSVLQTMFLPFVSAGKESGLGLGLTLALQIAQEHGGSMEFSQSDLGTNFTLVLPASILAYAGSFNPLHSSSPDATGHGMPDEVSVSAANQFWAEEKR